MKDTTQDPIQSELDERLSRVAAQIREGRLPPAEQLDTIDRLSKLKALYPAKDDHPRKIAEIVLLIVAVTALLCSVYFRMPSTSVELEIHVSTVKIGFTENRPNLFFPGEPGEVVALKQASISGATDIDPPWVSHDDGTLELAEEKSRSGSAGSASSDIALRLQGLTVPSNGTLNLVIGIAYRPDLRGLILAVDSSQPSLANFSVPHYEADAQNTEPPFSVVTVAGKNLIVELFPVGTLTRLTALRNVEISNVNFEEAGNSGLLGGSLFVKSLSQSRILVQPGDHLQIKSDQPMLIRELAFSKGQLEATISASSATAIFLGDKHPQNLMPSFFDWVRSRWPTQLYATISALVALWLAVKHWWRPSA
jgi:hypothetical protein